ncbi:GNAT family N-acetyltransferase [Halomicronema hongdechloris]|uniref:GNAT family N-acetyltransferase n=1 Tax=Halomicronema hongdechloris TaxID=1209493 RepID=UPI001CEC7795|nr:GNAT family N-acetyltransferase [Halomicronema hongdechloris]
MPHPCLPRRPLIPGYVLGQGSCLDRAQLVKYMARTYAEISPQVSQSHIAATVENHLSPATPLWWVWQASPDVGDPVACLWLGNAVDQLSGQRHAYLLVLYVDPAHRRQGIATALMHQAQTWATQRGDHQIGLQVLSNNVTALTLYRRLGYVSHAIMMTKPLP